MTREEAINYLIAYACCGICGLYCEDCPMYTGFGHPCADWTNDDICKAVRELREVE